MSITYEELVKSMITKKNPNPVDLHVGGRVRMRRMMVGMSQERLGEALGLTFQQVQKYEKGTNRIGASRLQQISNILEVPVEFFFEGLSGSQTVGVGGLQEAPSGSYIANFLSSSEGVQLTKAFMRIRDEKVRRKIIDMVNAIGDIDTSGKIPDNIPS
jgi:transcriptional regulator with XRE-family HTH domain